VGDEVVLEEEAHALRKGEGREELLELPLKFLVQLRKIK
jgi:hypothetical protein